MYTYKYELKKIILYFYILYILYSHHNLEVLNIFFSFYNLWLIKFIFVIYKSNYEKKTVAEKRTVRFKTPIEESLDLDDSEENMKFLGPIK